MANSFLLKAGGKLGAIGAHMQGLRGIFTKLVEQHREATTLLARATSTDDPDARQETWYQLRRELLSHERGEVLVLYAELDARTTTHDIVEQHAREASELDAMIHRIDGISYDSPEWIPAMQQLAELVERHVRDEENDFFPRAQEALGEELSQRLEARFLTAKHEALKIIV